MADDKLRQAAERYLLETEQMPFSRRTREVSIAMLVDMIQDSALTILYDYAEEADERLMALRLGKGATK